MGRIQNTTKYQIDDPVEMTDHVIGTEMSTGLTKNYMLQNIYEKFLEVLSPLCIEYDDVEDVSSLYDYHGGTKPLTGDWIINRYLKTDISQKNKAVFGSNQNYFDLDSAWAEKETLTYI